MRLQANSPEELGTMLRPYAEEYKAIGDEIDVLATRRLEVRKTLEESLQTLEVNMVVWPSGDSVLRLLRYPITKIVPNDKLRILLDEAGLQDCYKLVVDDKKVVKAIRRGALDVAAVGEVTEIKMSHGVTVRLVKPKAEQEPEPE